MVRSLRVGCVYADAPSLRCRPSRYAAASSPAVTYATHPLDFVSSSAHFSHIFVFVFVYLVYLFETTRSQRRWNRVPFRAFL